MLLGRGFKKPSNVVARCHRVGADVGHGLHRTSTGERGSADLTTESHERVLKKPFRDILAERCVGVSVWGRPMLGNLRT